MRVHLPPVVKKAQPSDHVLKSRNDEYALPEKKSVQKNSFNQ